MRANIPLQLTRFIGREREIGDVRRLLVETRLLTLNGPAGAGKTRLAIEVVGQVKEMYEGDTVSVDLASITDESLLSQAVAKAVNVKEQPGQSVKETLVSFFGKKQFLLILDNCEHLRAACRQLVSTLLSETPISILTTSREPLSVTGEKLYPIPPLSLPSPSLTEATVANAIQFDAIQLFVE